MKINLKFIAKYYKMKMNIRNDLAINFISKIEYKRRILNIFYC